MRLLLLFLVAATAPTQVINVRHRAPSASSACLSGYAHCYSLTVPTITSGPVTNYVALISETIGAGKVNDSNCYDVGFSSGKTSGLLPWDNVQSKCNAATGAVTAYVLLSSANTGSVIWVQYGGTQNTYQSTRTDVWASYAARWSLSEPSGSYADSTGNSATLTPANITMSATGGPVEGAAAFNGTTSIATKAMQASLDVVSDNTFTLEVWVKPTGTTRIGVLGYDRETGATPILGLNYSASLRFYSEINSNPTGLSSEWAENVRDVRDGAWHHVAYTRNGTAGSVARHYHDGVSSVAVVTDNTTVVPTGQFILGRWSSALGRYFLGQMAEVRLSPTVRSAAYFTATWGNYAAPATWFARGTEQ